jgi:MoxR-like ATPase
MSSADPLPADSQPLTDLIERLETIVVGQRALLERLVIALLAGGHVLVEGVPGLAKTLAVRALALALDLPFRRIQFTPDLLPADLTGTQVYRPATGTFDARLGPIVTSVLLADEINRAPAKVQSALLEAMQERQVTIGDQTFALPNPFLVLATQNPLEQ